jgi:hypothetical protein
MRLAFRIWIDGLLTIEEFGTSTIGPGEGWMQWIERTAKKHALQLEDTNGSRHLCEVEFLDEPDQGKRFFRFGSDLGFARGGELHELPTHRA